MADNHTITNTFTVSGQVTYADIDAAAGKGVKTIINNRPDGEAPDQPLNADLAKYAESKGISWHYIPMVPGELSMEHIEKTAAALDAEEKTHAFCKSGGRASTLWGLATAFKGTKDIDSIIEAADKAGYDLSGLRPTMENLYDKG